MIQLIAFVMACLVWQAIKDSIRGTKKPTVTLRVGGLHAVAECGCDTVTEDGKQRVVNPCQAHRIMLDLK